MRPPTVSVNIEGNTLSYDVADCRGVNLFFRQCTGSTRVLRPLKVLLSIFRGSSSIVGAWGWWLLERT